MLEVRLLGSPRVERDGESVRFDTRKAMALLAYLALSDRPRPRDAVADLLWPDQDVDHARGALRRTLSTLRAAVGPAWIDATRDQVRMVSGPGLVVDVQRFRSLAAAGDIEAAATVFRGKLLEGFFISGAPAFEEWQGTEAESLRRELAAVLANLAARHESAGDLIGALDVVRRWLKLDELHEPAHRALIRLSALTGNRADALTQYRECVRTLDRELGVAPLRETTLLYEAISKGTIEVPVVVSEPRRREPPDLRMVGRDSSLRALLAEHRDAHRDGRVVVIEGEAGIGKTRLAEEFLARLRRQGSVTVVGRAFEEESALAYAPVVEALRARLREDSDWLEQLPVMARQQAARLLPELSPTGAEPAPPPDTPGAAESFLAGMWETLVAATAGAQPGVIHIDDAQWADDASLRLLGYGLRRLRGRPLLVLLTWRTPHDHSFRRIVAELIRAGRGGMHSLQRLDVHNVGELLDTAHPDRLGTGLEQRLFAETEGLPYLVVEYLRVLEFDGDDSWSLPEGARELLRSRLDPVSETARQILSAAAVIGRSFDTSSVRATSGRAEDETVAALEELTRYGLIQAGSLDYDFTHEKLRAAVYAETSPARLRLLHRRAAQTTIGAAAARHLQLAGHERAAAEAYVRAADQARSVFANTEAIGYLRAALALGHSDPSMLQVGIGDLQTLQGDYPGALASYESAAATASPDRLGGIEHRLGQVHHRRGEWALADARLTAALAVTPAPDDGLRARITADLSLTAHSAGDAVGAAHLAREARELASSAGDLSALAQADNLLGLLAASAGRTDDALAHLRASLELAEQVDDVSACVAALNNLALAHRSRGEVDRAIELTHAALARCAAQGDRHREAALHNNLADLLHALGDPDEAMQHLKQAVALFAEVGAEGPLKPEIWKLVRW